MTQLKLNEFSGIFTDLSLASEELSRIRQLVHDQWLGHIKIIAPEHVN